MNRSTLYIFFLLIVWLNSAMPVVNEFASTQTKLDSVVEVYNFDNLPNGNITTSSRQNIQFNGDFEYVLNGGIMLAFRGNSSYVKLDRDIVLPPDGSSILWSMKCKNDWQGTSQNNKMQLFSEVKGGISGHITVAEDMVRIESPDNNRWIGKFEDIPDCTEKRDYALVSVKDSTRLIVDGKIVDSIEEYGGKQFRIRYIGAPGKETNYGGNFKGEFGKVGFFNSSLSGDQIKAFFANNFISKLVLMPEIYLLNFSFWTIFLLIYLQYRWLNGFK